MIPRPLGRRVGRTIGAILALALAVSVPPVLLVPGPPSAAAEPRDFSPGNIISDAVFQDSSAMSEGEIQAFLETRGANCVAGEMPCLKNYRETTRTRPVEVGLCWQYGGATNESAAAIIAKVSSACGINPRVLLVILEKENSLVTRTRPTTRSYNAAMGFGCPDTAPCNTEYYGFSNQVYRAARQYLVYRANPTRYGYQAGRTNSILFHPNASCGSASVYIENQATAGLYIYTPYQPNSAALANLYGTGDACSSYGNRNFWRLFTDWFGPPTAGSFLVRTEADPTVYLISGSMKHPIADWSTYLAFADRLGPLGYTSAGYLAGRTTGEPLSRIVRDAGDGRIYLIAGGQRLHFPSCSVVDAWGGGACARYTTLSSSQVAAFPAGPTLSDLVSSSSGPLFWMSGGSKREVLDASLAPGTGAVGPTVRLSADVLAPIPYGQPVMPADSVVTARGTSSPLWLTQGTTKHALPPDARSQTAFSTIPRGTLDATSIEALTTGTPFTGKVAESSGAQYLVTNSGLTPLSGVVGAVPGSAVGLSATSMARFPRLAAPGRKVFARSAERPEVYLLEDGVRRWARTWADLTSIAGNGAPQVQVVPQTTLDAIPTAGEAVPPGTLVKTANRPEIYLVDGSTRIHLESFVEAQELGRTTWRTVDTATVDGLKRSGKPLSSIVTCESKPFVGQGGALATRRPASADPPSLPVTPLSAASCATLRVSAGAAYTGPVFVKGSGPTVYAVGPAGKTAVTSWDALVTMNRPHGAPLIATLNDAALARIP